MMNSNAGWKAKLSEPMTGYRARIAVVVVGLLLAGATIAAAADPAAEDAARGERLARQWCTGCHLIGPGVAGGDAGPPFAHVANDPGKSDVALRTWLADPHPPMPKLELTRRGIDAIAAYIKTLKTE